MSKSLLFIFFSTFSKLSIIIEKKGRIDICSFSELCFFISSIALDKKLYSKSEGLIKFLIPTPTK